MKAGANERRFNKYFKVLRRAAPADSFSCLYHAYHANQNNKRKLARLITQYRDIFFPIFWKARPSFFRVSQRMTKVFKVTSLKYGKYGITNEKINNNKRLIDRAR